VKHPFRERIDSLSEGRARDRKRQGERADAGERRFTVFAWIVGRVDAPSATTSRSDGADARWQWHRVEESNAT